MLFIDSSAGKEPPLKPPSADRTPVPTPLRKPVLLSEVRPVRGRDREMQQLIHDLAVLAAKHDQQVIGRPSPTGGSP
ncbi:hypothetical protein ABIB27_003902 [Arthrobacter sp. UYEF21]